MQDQQSRGSTMSFNKRARLIWIASGLVALIVLVSALVLRYDGRGPSRRVAGTEHRIPIAVLGDSDSAAYQQAEPAGGDFHSITWQWPEVLARMRGGELDLGDWGTWGVPRYLSLTRVRALWGQQWRGPRKMDYRHNFAWASGCESLLDSAWAQAPQLRALMDEDPRYWRKGVVVIRIGVNSFGNEPWLSQLALDPGDEQVGVRMTNCANNYSRTISYLRERHPDVRFIIVGIYNNAHWTRLLGKWQSAREQANLDIGLDRFDNALRRLASDTPGVAFFNDREWFSRHWGSRGLDGKPDYRKVVIAGTIAVANTAGDSPVNAVLGNLHAGLVWNVLWVQSLTDLARKELALNVEPIHDDEVRKFLRQVLASPGLPAIQ
jgi:hypothetical protein